MARQNRRELWWIQRSGFRLPFRVSSRAGGLSCAVAAALATLLFYESSYKTALPFAFLAIIVWTAILFGRLAGVLGTVIASLVFASVLFEPRPSLAVDDPVARAHLAWMAAVGVVLSDLIGRRKIAATSATRKSGG
jgi:K+-sensing histidine kinase KdpD